MHLMLNTISRKALVVVMFVSSVSVLSQNKQDLQSADAAFRTGYAAVQKGNLAEARRNFLNVIALAPGIGAGHSALGAVLVQLGEFPAAIAELKRALSVNNDDSAAQANLAIAYERTGDHTLAIHYFETIETRKQLLDTNSALLFARALVADGQLERAHNTLQQFLDGNPDNPKLRDALGVVEAQEHKFEDAEVDFRKSILLMPNSADAHMHFGMLLIRMGQAEDALRELETTVRIAPENVTARLEMAKALLASCPAKAVEVLKQAQALAPSSLEVKYQLALAFQANNEARASMPLFEEVIDANPKNAPALNNLGLVLVQTGRAKEAISLYKRALAVTPNDPIIHQDLGVAYLQVADLNDAVAEFRAGLSLSPEAYELHYDLGLALKLEDDIAAAIPELQRAAELNPASPDPPFTLGILYMQIGHSDDAVVNLKATLGLRPDNGDAWAVLGSVYKQQSRLHEALEALQRAVVLLPTQPSPRMTLASVVAQLGRTAEAANLRKQAAMLTKEAMNRQRATFETNTGDTLFKKGAIADAIAAYRQAIASDPDFPGAHRQLAAALRQQGRSAEGAAEYAKAEELRAKITVPSSESH